MNSLIIKNASCVLQEAFDGLRHRLSISDECVRDRSEKLPTLFAGDL